MTMVSSFSPLRPEDHFLGILEAGLRGSSLRRSIVSWSSVELLGDQGRSRRLKGSSLLLVRVVLGQLPELVHPLGMHGRRPDV